MTKDAAHTEADGIDVTGAFPTVFCLGCMRHLPASAHHDCPGLIPPRDTRADARASLANGYRLERDDWHARYREAVRQCDALVADNNALRKQLKDALAMLVKAREVVRT